MRLGSLSLVIACLFSATGALAQVPEAYREGSFYDEIARDAARLGVAPEDFLDVSCVNDVYAQNPCPGVVSAWYEFTEKHDLPRTQQTSQMLRAYLNRDYKTADRLYALTKGYSLPEEKLAPDSVSASVRKYGVPRSDGRDTACSNDVLAPKPCPKAVRAWRLFAEEHGLELNRQTAKMFDAYIEGREGEGDELYATAKQTWDGPPRNEIHAEVLSYGVRRRPGLEVGECENNYYAAFPCLDAVRAWRQFADKHGLELNKQTANLFEAYVEGDPVSGDKLYASAKGITVAELLEKRGYKVDPVSSGSRLYVPIYPSGAGR